LIGRLKEIQVFLDEVDERAIHRGAFFDLMKIIKEYGQEEYLRGLDDGYRHRI